MHKKDYIFNGISLVMIFLSICFLFDFITIENFDFNFYTICFLISMAILMWYKKDSIKKFKFIYDVILILLLVFSVIVGFTFIFNIVTCMFREEYILNWESNGLCILLVELFSLFLIYLFDFKKKKNTLNHILVWLVSIILIVLVLRYNYDIDFVHNYLNYKRYELHQSYMYITQYYLYFNIIYFCLLSHYFLNREK